jgi:dethiobiotin synthetase
MTQTVLFVGTDTDVGKTHAVCLIARAFIERHHSIGVYKPVASGCEIRDGVRWSSDAQRLWKAAGRPLSLDQVCPQRFLAPLAPDQAARIENSQVDEDQIRSGLRPWRDAFDVVLVEGAGGLMSPLSDDWLNIDLVTELEIDQVVLVAANRIGVIHQVLVCIEAAAHRSVRIDGIILSTTDDANDPSRVTNLDALCLRTKVPVFANLPFDCQHWPSDVWPIPGISPE